VEIILKDDTFVVAKYTNDEYINGLAKYLDVVAHARVGTWEDGGVLLMGRVQYDKLMEVLAAQAVGGSA
jgi:hypothetical protein